MTIATDPDILSAVCDPLFSWLQSTDASPRSTEDWLRGFKFPSISDSDPPFTWIERCVRSKPPSREEFETRLAERLAPLLDAIPRSVENSRVEESLQYNLYRLCESISKPSILFEPLCRVYERLDTNRENLPGILAQGALRDALIANQTDDRFWPVWESMLQGNRHPVLLGDFDTGFHGIGTGLGQYAGTICGDANRREKLRDRFQSEVPITNCSANSWNLQLIKMAHKYRWDLWAVDCLPDHVFSLVPNAERSEWILSNWIATILLGLDAPHVSEQLCHGRLAKYKLSTADANELDQSSNEIRIIEEHRRNVPIKSDRAVIGVITDVIFEIVAFGDGPHAKDSNVELRRQEYFEKAIDDRLAWTV